jgi:hypothetical protein
MLPIEGFTDHVTAVLVAPVTVAVNCRVWPEVKVALDGETDTLTFVCRGDTVTEVVFVTPPAVAVTCTEVAEVAELAWSVNCRLVEPAGIVKLVGIVTLAPAAE